MTEKMKRLAEQNVYKAQLAYHSQHPQWVALAIAAFGRWGRQEMTLTHAVAEALREAYEAGARGEPIPQAPSLHDEHDDGSTVPARVRRTRPTPASPPARFVRRRR